MDATHTYIPGLENVIAVQTRISHIDGQGGRFIYRGYDTNELVLNHSFEDVWHLLLYGELPTPEERHTFKATIFDAMTLSDETLRVIQTLPSDAPFMAALRSALSATLTGMAPTIDLTQEALLRDCIHAAAIIPAVLAATYRLSHGLPLIAPDPTLPWAVNYLWMLTGEQPTEDQIKAITRYMILVADHGLNASTFTARVVASTGADVGAAVVAAVGALSGPLHGGAPSRVLEMLEEIGSIEQAKAWAVETIQTGGKIMGFGHRVYKTYDPRALALKETAREMNVPLLPYAETVERIISETFSELKPGRRIFTNVEYYSAVALEGVGLNRALFTPTFVAARAVGWVSHIYEQLQNNRIMRPDAQYIGPEVRPVPA
ncbi:MAG: citrate synthase CitA [Anaerolineae bacterium]